MKARTDWVDYAKAIGIILVVYGHVARGLFNVGIDISEDLYQLADSIVYSFHMPLFFFLSGLFFYHSFVKRGGFGLAFNKIDTIVYPYLLWSLLQGGIEVIFSNYTSGSVSILDILKVWEPRAQFWFLYALFFVFLSAIFVYSCVSEKYTIIVLLLSGVLYITQTKFPYIQILAFINDNFVFFVLGIVFVKYKIDEMFSPLVVLLVSMVAFVIAQYLFHIFFDKTYIDKGLGSLLLSCISILFVVFLSITLSKCTGRFFASLGAASMAIYLMHILAGSGIRIVLSKVFGVESFAIHLFAGCLFGLLLPLLAFQIITSFRIPFILSAPLSKYFPSYLKS